MSKRARKQPQRSCRPPSRQDSGIFPSIVGRTNDGKSEVAIYSGELFSLAPHSTTSSTPYSGKHLGWSAARSTPCNAPARSDQ
ncbi:hypothetical protein E3N88_10046 [Mikania micrantha]|uniref:Uncharacterized protein n=1 Tax=Mikania micrantha TaxID=192012 RepID=A0A5N6P9K2_9ASTR|nr:hypothetical protein E3N88_10046 [Mikania micrantha]